ncbi:GNAT family N-acetyltransferase [Paenibacillus sp. SC116]|uniref:GNAT family N-acetyltransferase n=1 Tax=Paenibacillus sp. SC116 TaxID=2968986 RepID=UPI00215A7960|nr:GNAT family N-acetyltransferase [Paenibacillus sp. SC116]MCR8842663.1 GNAT family N-acetyltransferase [Paenibacillus sp. SC116]
MVTIRKSLPQDAKKSAKLMFDAMDWLGDLLQLNTERSTELVQTLYLKTGTRFSSEYTYVVDIDGEVAGILTTAAGSNLDRLNLRAAVSSFSFITGKTLKNVAKHAGSLLKTKEALNDEYYITTLSVDSKFRGKGIGSKLMDLAEKLARENGFRKCSLTVDASNEKARRLYNQLGYVEQSQFKLMHYTFVRMVKSL